MESRDMLFSFTQVKQAYSRDQQKRYPDFGSRGCVLIILTFSYLFTLVGTAYAQSASIAIVDDRSVHVPYEYEVEDGDTLWLISQEFFNDPWLWPNLWALNPHITNPHWIYPGDIIRLKWTSQAVAEAMQ